MSRHIHPTAVIDPQSELGENVSIGPFCIVQAGAVVGSGCQLLKGAVVTSAVKMGENNTVCENVVLGGPPQHATANGPFGGVVIGRGNTFRENCTVHCSMHQGQQTTVGDNCYFMVNAHVGHDSAIVGDLIIANNVMIGGHVTVGRKAFVSGGVAIHQFCRVGEYAMVGGQARVVQDVPPYVTVDGLSSKVVGLNLIGLKRAGFTAADIVQLKAAYRVIYRSGLRWVDVMSQLREQFSQGPAAQFEAFLAHSTRGIVSARRSAQPATIKFPRKPDALPEDGELRKAS